LKLLFLSYSSDTNKIQDLIPYVESLIWGGRKCNIECVHQLEDFLLASFGPETQAQILEFKQVTPEVHPFLIPLFTNPIF